MNASSEFMCKVTYILKSVWNTFSHAPKFHHLQSDVFLFPPLLLQRFINLCEQHSCSKGNHMNSSQTISKNFYLQGQQNNTGIPNVVLGPCGDLTRWLMHFLSTSPLIFNTNDKSHKFYFSWKIHFSDKCKTYENLWKLMKTTNLISFTFHEICFLHCFWRLGVCGCELVAL